MPRYAARSDKNQQEIIDALRGVGASVSSIHRAGHGVPDLLVGYRGVTYLMEVKHGNSKLTADERKWHDEWRGQVAIVRNVREAITTIDPDVELIGAW